MSQYASFLLSGRYFGLNILGVREIIRPYDLTPVPLAQPYIRGLLNLRGQVVTILDLAVRLGMDKQDITPKSHIIILKTRQELVPLHQRGEAKGLAGVEDLVGLLVDAIGDVVEAEESQFEPPPANASELDTRFISGIYKSQTRLLTLLNLKETLSSVETTAPATLESTRR